MLSGILETPIFRPRPLFPARLLQLPLKKRAFIIPILRKLLYTAVTRGKKTVDLVTNEQNLKHAVCTNDRRIPHLGLYLEKAKMVPF